MEIIIFQTLIIITIISFFVGYIFGKSNIETIKISPLLKNKQTLQQKVSIDTSKYVTTIKTDNLEKKYDNLGDEKKTNENIDLSVNKLKSMKG